MDYNLIKKETTEETEARWSKDGKDKIRYQYNLNEDSVVFDVGGYKGHFTDEIYKKYKCSIYVFEPVSIYYNNLVNKYRFYDDIYVYNVGLGTKDEKVKIGVCGDSSSIYKITQNMELIKIIDIRKIIKKTNVKFIDLMKINIEGAEYEFLESLLEYTTVINKINNIQIQFHSPDYGVSIDDYKKRRKEIHKKLLKTHNLDWCYPFIWESWSLK